MLIIIIITISQLTNEFEYIFISIRCLNCPFHEMPSNIFHSFYLFFCPFIVALQNLSVFSIKVLDIKHCKYFLMVSHPSGNPVYGILNFDSMKFIHFQAMVCVLVV